MKRTHRNQQVEQNHRLSDQRAAPHVCRTKREESELGVGSRREKVQSYLRRENPAGLNNPTEEQQLCPRLSAATHAPLRENLFMEEEDCGRSLQGSR